MARIQFPWLTILNSLAMAAALGFAVQQPGLNDQFEKAVKEAARKVGPSVVQIQTQGGADLLVTSPKGPVFRKAFGPTSGVVVDADGYIISSAFNFLNNPATIIVWIPGDKEPLVAKRIATDKTRMLTLLKVEKKGLVVPQFVPNKELKVGQSSLAMGRTLDFKAFDAKSDQPPSVSHGIISALGRVWGKAIQTDAKISPVNYGGPLVDVAGRVQGIIIPASPQGEDVTAGFEWYDSGIGFAIPMEDVMAALPRLKQGKDLEKAALGVKMKGTNQYGVAPEVQSVVPGSAAQKAGLKEGDIILEVDGKSVVNQAQIQHLIGPKYVGDLVSLKIRRDKEEIAVPKVELLAIKKNASHEHAYLGILAVRDDPKLGVEVRHVFPGSPAHTTGLAIGDRIVKYGRTKDKMASFKGSKRGREELADFLNTVAPGTEIALGVTDKEGKDKENVVLKLDVLPGSTRGKEDTVPAKLPGLASAKKALQPLEVGKAGDKPLKKEAAEAEGDKKAETGMLKRLNTGGDRRYWIYVHKGYNPQISHAVVAWLHMPGKFSDDDSEKTADLWDEYCKENNIILVGPITDQDGGWTPSDTDLVLEAISDVTSRYTIDHNRIIAHGLGNGGQMAFNLAFSAREVFRGAATLGAVLTEPLDNLANERVAFYVAGGDRDPVIKGISESRDKLVENHFPVFYRQFVNRGREYLDDEGLAELVRWIEMMDRL